MAKINDVTSSDIRLAAALHRLNNASILYKDKQDIEDFYYSMRRANLKKETQLDYINLLKKTCEYYQEIGIEKPLREIELRDFDKLLFYLEEELHRKDWTINQYKKAFRKFMKWAYGRDLPSWVTNEIKLKKVAVRIQPEDVPTREEFTDFINAASTPRDKAIIAVAGDSGIRISALLSCTISSFVENQHAAILYLNPEGPLKTTAAKGIPLTWSAAYVQHWLTNHPFREDPKAPLWTTNVRKRSDPTDPESKLEYQALSYSAAYKMFLAVEARLNQHKHTHPHMLRHYAVTNWILDGLPEQIIKHRAGWGPDSKEMSRYGNWTDEDLNTQIYEIYGLKKEDKRSIELKTCPRCNNILKPGDRFCSQCSLVLDHTASLEMEEEKTTAAKAIEYLSNTNPQKLLEIMQEKVSQWEHDKEK
jgi:integrase